MDELETCEECRGSGVSETCDYCYSLEEEAEWEAKERHIELHKMLDELVADFISQTNNLPSKTTVMELMKWAYEQTVDEG